MGEDFFILNSNKKNNNSEHFQPRGVQCFDESSF